MFPVSEPLTSLRTKQSVCLATTTTAPNVYPTETVSLATLLKNGNSTLPLSDVFLWMASTTMEVTKRRFLATLSVSLAAEQPTTPV